MATGKPERVRERAYHLWQESGGQHGSADEHWYQAEREVGATASLQDNAPKGADQTAATKGAGKPKAEGAKSATAKTKAVPPKSAKAETHKPSAAKPRSPRSSAPSA